MTNFNSGCAARPDDRRCGTVNVGDTERAVSAIAGGFALLYGLSRLSLASLVALVAGGALLSRGLTGHCSFYEALDMSTIDNAPAGDSCGTRQPDASGRVTDVALAATGESNQRSATVAPFD